MSNNNYAYQTGLPFSAPSNSTSYRKGSANFSTTFLSPMNSYKKEYSNTSLQPNESASLSFKNSEREYRDVKRLPEEFSSLRQTFDIRSNNRIKDMISKSESQDNGQGQFHREVPSSYTSRNNLEVPRYEQNDQILYSPKVINKSKNTEFDEKLKKFNNTVEEFNSHIETTNKMSEEIKKLKEDRRKRMEAKEREKEDYSLSNSYSSTGFTSPTYRSPTSGNEAKEKLREDSDGFKKKRSYENESYTPKYEKKSYQSFSQVAEEVTNVHLEKYKEKKQTEEPPKSAYETKSPKHEKIEKYEQKISYSTKTTIPSSTSNKKIVDSIKYVEVNNFILGKSLGEGKFGTVYQAIHKPTGWLYAIKKVPKEMIRSHLMIDQFILELKLQTFLYHENILTLYTHFDDKESLYLVLEYMEEGTLFSHLKKNKIIPEEEVALKIREIASSVKYLHENEIAHRDIKPENIVMSHGVCKLCDFGWATICSERRKTYCGTFDYAPPEILEGVEYDYTADLWCLGVLTYELLVGKAPFYHISRKETMKKILDVDHKAIEYPQTLSKTAINFIDSLIKKDPKQRLSSDMLLEHPFLKNVNRQNTNKN